MKVIRPIGHLAWQCAAVPKSSGCGGAGAVALDLHHHSKLQPSKDRSRAGAFVIQRATPPAPHHRLEQCSCCSSIQLAQQYGNLPAALASALLLPRLPTSPFHFRFKLDQEQVARSGSDGGVRRTSASLGVGGRLDGYVIATTTSAPPPGNTNSETIEARQLLDGGHGHIQVRGAALVFQLGLAISSGRTLTPPSSFFCGEGIENTSPVWALTLFRAVPSALRAQTGAVSSTGHLRYPPCQIKMEHSAERGESKFHAKTYLLHLSLWVNDVP